MEMQKVDFFMMTNNKFFEPSQLAHLQDRLASLDDNQWKRVQIVQFKDPMFIQIASFLGGQLGIDRFLIGDVGLGIAKMLTCGGFGLWTIIDWFMIQSAAREKNASLLSDAFLN